MQGQYIMPAQLPQWTEFLSCPICYNVFNERAQRPISLGCGHTICKLCLINLHQKKCPFDQSLITRDLEELPVNFALLQLVGVAIPEDNQPSPSALAGNSQYYQSAKRCIEEMAILLKPVSTTAGACAAINTSATPVLSRPMQRKLVTLVNCQLMEEEGRARAVRAARSLGERTVTEMILQHQNSQQLSANLWAAVRARGCQFLGPAMQEEVLKLILLALEDGSALSRKVLVLFVVQRLASQYPQASKTAIGHVVQLLYRASCFKVTKREEESSLMQLKEEFRTYEAHRREHDSQIVQIATEAGLRISPEQWSSLLYGDTTHKPHMQSIIDKLQTPQSFVQSVNELVIALQRSGDPGNLSRLRPHYELLANIDPNPDILPPSWENLDAVIKAVKTVVQGLVEFSDTNGGQRKAEPVIVQNNTKYKTHMCRDLAQKGRCPRGNNCTFAHSQEEMERYRVKGKRPGKVGTENMPNIMASSALSPCEHEQLVAVALATKDKMLSKATHEVCLEELKTVEQTVYSDGVDKSPVNVPVMKPSVLPASAKMNPNRQTIYTSPNVNMDTTQVELIPISQRFPSMTAKQTKSPYNVPSHLVGKIEEYPTRLQYVSSPGGVPQASSNFLINGMSANSVAAVKPSGVVEFAAEPDTVQITHHNAEIIHPSMLIADDQAMRSTMKLPPNPYTTESYEMPTKDSHYYLASNIAHFTRGKSPSQQLDELQQRKRELLSQLSMTAHRGPRLEVSQAGTPPVAHVYPQAAVSMSNPPTNPVSLSMSVADSLASTLTTMSLDKKIHYPPGQEAKWAMSSTSWSGVCPEPVVKPVEYHAITTQQQPNPASYPVKPSQLATPDLDYNTFPTEDIPVIPSLPLEVDADFDEGDSSSLSPNHYATDAKFEEEDDEFVPFEHTVVSKYGPISRMAKAKMKSTGPLNVTAAQDNTIIAVTAVTPMKRPFPISSPVPSRFTISKLGQVAHPEEFDRLAMLQSQGAHDHIADPRGVEIATSLPTALMQPNLIAVSNKAGPHTLWEVRDRLGDDLNRNTKYPSNSNQSAEVDSAVLSPATIITKKNEREQLCQELLTLNVKIGNLQHSEDERLARELQAIELNIQEAERKLQHDDGMKQAAQKRKQVEQDRRLAQKIVLDEAREKGICVRREGNNSQGIRQMTS